MHGLPLVTLPVRGAPQQTADGFEIFEANKLTDALRGERDTPTRNPNGIIEAKGRGAAPFLPHEFPGCSRAIIPHGEPAPTDRDHCPHAHQVSRVDEADAGKPSAGRSDHRQKSLRLLPETS